MFSARRFRRVRAGLLGAAFAACCGGGVPALAADSGAPNNDAVAMALDHKAQMLKNPLAGVFVAVASAGSRLVAVGEHGRILLSDDDGRSWRQVETPTSVTLTDVVFATKEDGWAVGQMGIVLHSLDGGLHWLKTFDGLQANTKLVSAAAADLQNATAGTKDLATANLQAAQQFLSGGPDVPFLNILALSPENLVLAGGYGMAFTSRDGGATWQSIFDEIPNPNGLHIYALLQADAGGQKGIFFIGEQGFLVRGDITNNATLAMNFTALNPPFQGSFFGGLETPGHALLLYGLQGTILRSTDGGKSWTLTTSAPAAGIDCGIVLRNGTVVLGDLGGNLLVSHDDGVTFSVFPQDVPVTGLAEAPDGAIIEATAQGVTRLDGAKLKAGA